MAVNQAQVDHIITAASEDDPEVKLQNLEREVDLIKTSIKRLLMDIRERMNELENPFTLAAAGGGGKAESAGNEARLAALEAKEAALEAREAELSAAKSQAEEQKKQEPVAVPQPPVAQPQAASPAPKYQIVDEQRMVDEQLLAQFKAQLIGKPSSERIPAAQPTEKFRLQKVYKLFKWTSLAVRKYGHDRLEIMLQSYRTMGYISKESCDEIREIARLMPGNLGDEHEVGPDEFVSELYTLNRIIAPDDTTLDRDMIEVMMEQRTSATGPSPLVPVSRIELAPAPQRDKRPAKEREFEEDWMNLPDRI